MDEYQPHFTASLVNYLYREQGCIFFVGKMHCKIQVLTDNTHTGRRALPSVGCPLYVSYLAPMAPFLERYQLAFFTSSYQLASME